MHSDSTPGAAELQEDTRVVEDSCARVKLLWKSCFVDARMAAITFLEISMTSLRRSFFVILLLSASLVSAQPASETPAIKEADVQLTEKKETPKSAAEIIKEIEEEALKYRQTEPLPDEAEGASTDANLEDVVTDVIIQETDDQNASAAVENSGFSEDESIPLAVSQFEKPAALDPVLLLQGRPEDEANEMNAVARLSGSLVPEKQMIGRRRHMFRWVLKTGDGSLIPLKSNLKLLQEVKKEANLDGFVTLTGRFVTSGFQNELKYFIVESLVSIDELPKPPVAKDIDNAAKPDSEQSKVFSKTATEPIELSDAMIEPETD